MRADPRPAFCDARPSRARSALPPRPHLVAVFFCYAGYRRIQIRHKFGLPGDDTLDYVSWMFCAPCALCQVRAARPQASPLPSVAALERAPPADSARLRRVGGCPFSQETRTLSFNNVVNGEWNGPSQQARGS